ncbi:DnaB-like helicase N-terminal domain-containing protein [Caballeronia sp. LP003]|uniref:DnaB-like helicase N-terminal domain-containing protein n=1 Tax=Caballeronia sp. LP003 TaxID=3038551 RepID=UPI0028654BA7|nr:DnaB-like helicase N-terminal domain-containing protein [Caballeronia sp. LP003]MDR5790307.1 DnaB-like helicase N-terminal domain-containing protein [Caballeronia sp. LP003]
MIDEGFPSYETDLQSRGERRVLACLLRRNDAICHCAWLMPSHFSSDLNGMIFAAIRALMARGERADLESVYAYLHETYPRYHVKPAYFYALDELDVHTSHIGSYAAKMREGDGHA